MPYSAVTKTSGAVDSVEQLPIRYDLYVPTGGGGEELPVIIFLHGFKGFKDWGAFPLACEDLAFSGFAVLAMNFSHNGVGESLTDFDRLDLFAQETLSRDLDNVGSVIEALQKGDIVDGKATLLTDRMGIIGHSRGGHTAIAAAAEYPALSTLVTWSAVADYMAHWSEQMVREWKDKGYTEIQNSRTGQVMRIDRVVYDDMLQNEERLNALKRVRELRLPVCFIHGKADEAVSAKEARKLYEACPSTDKEIKIIEGTGHTFDTAHPFEDEGYPAAFEEVMRLTRTWFETYL